MTSEDVQTNLRLPAELKERVVKAAVQNKRSLSAEVAARLEDSFQPKKLAPISAGDMTRLLETDEYTKRVFADQLRNTASQLIKEDHGLRDTTLELLTAAILLAEDRRRSRQDTGAILSNEEAINIVQAAKSKKQAKPIQPK